MKTVSLLSVLMVFVMGASQAGAATISFSDSDSGTGTDSGTLSVSQFDPSLGTLESVELVLVGNASGGSNQVDSEDTLDPGTVMLTIGVDITVTGPSSLATLAIPQETAFSNTIAADDEPGNPADFTGLDWFQLVGTSSSDTDTDTLTDPPDNLSPYIGLGNVTLDWNTANNFTVAADFTYAALTGAANFDFDATITYTYSTEIPEPASLAFLALGGLPLLLHRKRK